MLEKNLLILLLNPHIRVIVKPYVNQKMVSSRLFKFVLNFILHESFNDKEVNKILLFNFLESKNLLSNDQDRRVVEEIFSSYKSEKVNDIHLAIKQIEDFIKNKKISDAIDLVVSNEAKDYSYLIEATSFTIRTEETLDFSNEDVLLKVLNEDNFNGTSIVKSAFSLINDYSLYKGYKPRDLVMVAGETGIGKSSFLASEGAHFINQGKKVYHLSLGDLSRLDVILKYMSNWLNLEMTVVLKDFLMYGKLLKEKLKNLYVIFSPTDSLSIEQVISEAKILKKDFNFDCMIIDYDQNFHIADDGNMYNSGGRIYNQIKKFNDETDSICLIGSQVKTSFYGEEIIPKIAAAESSKKLNILDYMITLGRNKDCKKVGTINLAKVRRGQDNIQMRCAFRNKFGRIEEIPQENYDYLVKNPDDFDRFFSILKEKSDNKEKNI